MKKRKSIIVISIAVVMLLSTTLISFAETYDTKEYEITSISELKGRLSKLSNDPTEPLDKKEIVSLEKSTDPVIIQKFIEEKNKDIDEILKKDDTELVIEENQASYEKIYNIGDNCWIKFEFEEEKIPDIVSSVKSKFILETYALSRSGYKTGWQKYKSGKNTGKYKYTAKTTVNYGVASGTYSLRAYYQLTSKGVHVYKKLASGTDAGLLVVDVTDSGIDDAYATKPGASDCDLYATYKTTYGKDPVKWSRVYGMTLKIKYLSKDTVEKEIKTTREWRLKSL